MRSATNSFPFWSARCGGTPRLLWAAGRKPRCGAITTRLRRFWAARRKRGCSAAMAAASRPARTARSLSGLAGNCLVKRLPREQIFSLRRQKGYLQTAGLLCTPERRETLTQLLARCGVTRITRAGNMSAMFSGEAHDGDYPLRRYVRMVDIE